MLSAREKKPKPKQSTKPLSSLKHNDVYVAIQPLKETV